MVASYETAKIAEFAKVKVESVRLIGANEVRNGDYVRCTDCTASIDDGAWRYFQINLMTGEVTEWKEHEDSRDERMGL